MVAGHFGKMQYYIKFTTVAKEIVSRSLEPLGRRGNICLSARGYDALCGEKPDICIHPNPGQTALTYGI